ncbi:RNA polymerase, sigma-24 subunit, ECF subfamily [Rhizobium sp. CF080]|uniref:RNA polymerase sigma factor n=1 Tax=Rhizobium sp. (strain CF080) TaxID=1144310 RepID=UPI000271AC1E|nr:sigma-70 family RNA polymerase sigma factor [Rhizobium sp. CF080]EUB98944.1 RNA polymerase, sigma-24 subunit, ECF subfamily [Rhizobium sp. CF080]
MGMENDDMRSGLYATHRTALVAYAASLMGSREEAEEVVQDAFSKLSPDSIKGIDTPIAYLRRIVRNLALNRRRRQKYELAQATEQAPDWMQPLRVSTPEQDAVFNDQVRLIAQELTQFPHQTRLIIEMHRFDGYTLEEIANHLGLSVTTVHRILTNAMGHLTKRLASRLT